MLSPRKREKQVWEKRWPQADKHATISIQGKSKTATTRLLDLSFPLPPSKRTGHVGFPSTSRGIPKSSSCEGTKREASQPRDERRKRKETKKNEPGPAPSPLVIENPLCPLSSSSSPYLSIQALLPSFALSQVGSHSTPKPSINFLFDATIPRHLPCVPSDQNPS